MVMNRLIITMLAIIVMTATCFNSSWAEEASATGNEPGGGATAAAVVSDLIYVPGKAGTCVLSGALWTAAMVITGGTIYKEAGNFVHCACTGKWVIKGEDMASTKE